MPILCGMPMNLCCFPCKSHSAAVSFGVGLTSANTVGYNGSALDEEYGAVLTGPQFVTPGGSAFLLTNIVLVSEANTAYSVDIQTLNGFGGTGDEDYMWNGAGWEDANGNPVTDATLPPGKGFWVYNFTGEAVTFRSLGEVNANDVTYPLDTEYGAVAIVNPYPTDIALADITFITAQPASALAYSIDIQTLNSFGGTGDEDYMWNGTGWEDANGNPATNVTFAPGKGLWVYNFTGEAVGFHIPAPEL